MVNSAVTQLRSQHEKADKTWIFAVKFFFAKYGEKSMGSK